MLADINLLPSMSAAEDDDSPFLSMADFFSLISLSLIYSMLVLAPQTPLPQDAINVINGRLTTSEQDRAVNPHFAYIGLESRADAFRLRLVWNEWRLNEETEVSGTLSDIQNASEWIHQHLASHAAPERVIFHMRDDELPSEGHRLFNRLAQSARQRYTVSTVFIRPERKP
jgi:hypothetical protein